MSDKTIEGIQLDKDNKEFNNAIDIVQKTNLPIVYLTGKAGTGKTTFLKYLRKTTDKKLVVLAPTGVAAVNAGGQTIHSFFQIKPSVYVPNDKRLRKRSDSNDSDRSTIYDHFKYDSDKVAVINEMELLVIDEISMVRCDLLDVIDKLLRVFRENDAPFGGVQVVLIGDTFQLPPIVLQDERDLLRQHYASTFFFNSKVIERNRPIYIELKKIYRQQEQDFVDLLNRVRINRMSDADFRLLDRKYNPDFSPSDNQNYIMLATRNRDVEVYNAEKLENLKTDLHTYEGEVTGEFPEANMVTDKVLYLKEGAQVMIRKNNLPTYYNGTLGKIVQLEDDRISVEIGDETERKTISIEKVRWSNIRYSWDEEEKTVKEEVVGSFTQFPVKLAWAITVHKSQGLTFDKVIVDVGSAFAPGQVYVALSRCTSLNGLVLKSRITSNAVRTDFHVLDFARTETPETLIASELKAGKADFYYEKSRNAFRVAEYSECIDNFIKATKYRNDLETEQFRRFFVVMANRLASYGTRASSLLAANLALSDENKKIQDSLDIAEKNNETLQERINELVSTNVNLEESKRDLANKLDECQKKVLEVQNEAKKREDKKDSRIDKLVVEIKSRKNEERILKEQLEQKQKKEVADFVEINRLASENKSNDKTILNLQLQIQNLQNIIDGQRYQVGDLKEQLKGRDTEIERMKNIKWYEKLFGKN